MAAAPDLAGLIGPELYANSDLNEDGVHSEQDFFEFRKAYDAANGAGAFAALVSVPEPASIGLLGLGGLVVVAARRRRRSSEPPVIQQETTKPRGSRCLTKTSLLLAAILVLGIAALEERASAQLFVDDMGALSAANWTVIAPRGDATALFGHDYSAAGLPAAPNGSDTIGLRMEVNNSAGALTEVTAVHFDNAFTGQFTTQMDIWINWVVDPADPTDGLGQGTTEAVAVSIGQEVSTTNGGMQLVTGADSFEIISYEITSEGGSLNPGSFVGLDNDSARAADAIGDGDGEQWQTLITTDDRLVDGFLLGSSEFLAADAALLGAGYDTSVAAEDLEFAYRTLSGALLTGIVDYLPSDIELPGGDPVLGDLNGDGFVDGLDLGILLGNWDTTTTLAMGELNGTPPVDGLDLGILLGAWNPSLLSASGAVPEPSSALLLTISIALANAVARRRKPKMTRFDRGPTVLVCLAASLLTVSANASFVDRDYQLGESESTDGAGSVVGAGTGSFGVTWDDAGQPNMNQFHDLTPNNGPTYADISGRPDGGSGLGIQFDGTSYLRGRRLGDPSNSISALGSGFGTIDYNGVTNRYLQFWVRPSSVSGASSLVQDTSQHGVGIDEGNYSLRFNAGGARAGNVDSGVAAQADTWAHIMLVSQQQGSSPGRRLYIDGVGVAAQPGGYDVTAFVAGYNSVNLLNFVRVGDLSTRGMGDLNFDGGVDLRDWSLLNAADPAAGAAAMALIQVAGVPEPGALALLALGGAALMAIRRRAARGRPGS